MLRNNFSQLIQQKSFWADFVLAALLIGPIMAPFLVTWDIWGPSQVGRLIYTMGAYVCPQPIQAVPIAQGALMAVCMRCYGTLLGFLLLRLWFAIDHGSSWFWLPRYGMRGLIPFTILIMMYAAEFAGQVAGFWSFRNDVVLVAGLLTGIGLGLLFIPILHTNQVTKTAVFA